MRLQKGDAASRQRSGIAFFLSKRGILVYLFFKPFCRALGEAGVVFGVDIFVVAVAPVAAWESTAPTVKPTRLPAGMVICLPPRMDLTLRAATLRDIPRAEAHQTHFMVPGDFIAHYFGECVDNLAGVFQGQAGFGSNLVD